MIELFGLNLGTPLQGGTMVGVWVGVAIIIRTWIIASPERLRARTEAKKVAGDRHSADYLAWRKEVHGLRDELQTHIAISRKAESESHRCLNENRTMRYIIRLLITDNPGSEAAKQAREVLARLENGSSDLTKSPAMNVAEDAVLDAKQTVRSAEETVVELKHEEGK